MRFDCSPSAWMVGLATALSAACLAAGEVKPPEPWGPVPSKAQLQWHEMEYCGFLHFTVNTFTDKEWGDGDEDPAVFRPTALDTRQWARTARQAGMKGLILTAKHHDGFCLWPSKYTEHSVAGSPWKGGKGDVVRDLSQACREFGLRMGLYLSPWDRNHAEYGRPKYVEYYHRQLQELLGGYGPVCEVWFDGANGGGGYYGGARGQRHIDANTYYGFPAIWEQVRKLQPGAVMFSDIGPDVRWVGNEGGHAPDTCWAKVRPEGFRFGAADTGRLARGDPDGTVWRPAEVDVSIRPGWFYHPQEHPKSLKQLVEIYYNSVGMGANLLLNVPPDRRGQLAEEDVERLLELHRVLEATFRTDLARGRPATASNVRGGSPAFAAANVTDGDRDTYWAGDDAVREAWLAVDLGRPTAFDRVRLQEPIRLGQRIESFALDGRLDGRWTEIARGTTIGPRRILRLPPVEADAIRLRILKSQACPALSTFELYKSPEP